MKGYAESISNDHIGEPGVRSPEAIEATGTRICYAADKITQSLAQVVHLPLKWVTKRIPPPAAAEEFQSLANEIATSKFVLHRTDETSFGMGIETGIAYLVSFMKADSTLQFLTGDSLYEIIFHCQTEHFVPTLGSSVFSCFLANVIVLIQGDGEDRSSSIYQALFVFFRR